MLRFLASPGSQRSASGSPSSSRIGLSSLTDGANYGGRATGEAAGDGASSAVALERQHSGGTRRNVTAAGRGHEPHDRAGAPAASTDSTPDAVRAGIGRREPSKRARKKKSVGDDFLSADEALDESVGAEVIELVNGGKLSPVTPSDVNVGAIFHVRYSGAVVGNNAYYPAKILRRCPSTSVATDGGNSSSFDIEFVDDGPGRVEKDVPLRHIRRYDGPDVGECDAVPAASGRGRKRAGDPKAKKRSRRGGATAPSGDTSELREAVVAVVHPMTQSDAPQDVAEAAEAADCFESTIGDGVVAESTNNRTGPLGE